MFSGSGRCKEVTSQNAGRRDPSRSELICLSEGTPKRLRTGQPTPPRTAMRGEYEFVGLPTKVQSSLKPTEI